MMLGVVGDSEVSRTATQSSGKLTPSVAAWAPFLDDVNVIIFLAPVSVFNQSLAEDKTVNRLVGVTFVNLRPVLTSINSSTVSSSGSKYVGTDCSHQCSSLFCSTKLMSWRPSLKLV